MKLTSVLGMVVLAAPSARARGTIYVDGDIGGGDGTSWALAYDDLQDALADAGRGDQIWVAEGTYTPAASGGDRNAAFALKDGVAIYGGFLGNEISLAQRDPMLHPTILSGDLNGDDDSVGIAENSYSVVLALGVGTAVMDGFFVEAGNADDSFPFGPRTDGGGLYASDSDVTLVDCHFRENRSSFQGGGIYCTGASQIFLSGCSLSGNSAGDAAALLLTIGELTAVDCSFTSNTGQTSGAMFLGVGSTSSFLRCAFAGNSAAPPGLGGAANISGSSSSFTECSFWNNTAQDGGAMYVALSDLEVQRCRFVENAAAAAGSVGSGGALILPASLAVIVSSEFLGNSAAHDAGAIGGNASTTITCCTIAHNTADSDSNGAGVAAVLGARIRNSILWGNQDALGMVEDSQVSGATVDYCCVQGLTGALGGTANTGADPGFYDSLGPDGMLGTLDDDLRLFAGSPCIDAGDNDADVDVATPGAQPLGALDLEGLSRFADDVFSPDTGNGSPPIVDMGASEYRDCDDNAVPDYEDIAVGSSSDCNGDGIPDGCVEPLGACCFFNISCTVTTPADCQAIGGQFQGCGTTCEDELVCGAPCPPQLALFQVDAGIPDPVVLAHVTPAPWQAEDVSWARDQSPRNGIDDSIDAQPTGLIGVVVNYKDAVTQEDLDFLENLSATSTVTLVGRLVTYVAVDGLEYADVVQIADDPRVAFVERKFGFGGAQVASLQAMKVTTSAQYDGQTVEDLFPGLNGAGINIAILDSGVDNDVHLSLPDTNDPRFIGGYDAMNDVWGDPDDDLGHGTFVASIALGQASPFFPLGNTPGQVTAFTTGRGVAPEAGLIDVKVFDNTASLLTCAMGNTAWENVARGLETTILQHLKFKQGDPSGWKVDVINMSLRQCDGSPGGDGCSIRSDGLDTVSRLTDLATSVGIVVVAAMGNEGAAASCEFIVPASCVLPGPSAPGASTRAITVAAVDELDMGLEVGGVPAEADRVNHKVTCYSTPGPRLDDGDSDPRDELKPDVAAPGHDVLAARFNPDTFDVEWSLQVLGTSMAAPHVSGLAALLLQANPGLTPMQVKDLILRTAEPRGTPTLPTVDPVWNDKWGHGYVDAFIAVSEATTPLPGDLTFPSHPADPPWLSLDITTSSLPPVVGELTTITAQILNTGPQVDGVAIHFGVHVFSPTVGTFHDLATRIVDLPTGVTPVEADWVPAAGSHQCLHVEIGYGADQNPANNTARRNLAVIQGPTASFCVQNTASPEPLSIVFEVACDQGIGGGGGSSAWTIVCDPPAVTLTPEDPPLTVNAIAIPPFDAPAGETILVNVEATAVLPDLSVVTLGGVSFIAEKTDCNGNGTDDGLEIVAGMVADCNGNGVPDSCDLLSGAERDCNSNGIPDSCDIGTISVDVNGDGVPDECGLRRVDVYVGPLLKKQE